MDRCVRGLHQFLCALDHFIAGADQVLESFRIDRGSRILAEGGVVHRDAWVRLSLVRIDLVTIEAAWT